GWVQTSANPAGIAATSGVNATGIALGNFKMFSISGQLFRDVNGNGVRDAGEPGLFNWGVELDVGPQGTPDRTKTTDANGNYRFDNVGPGAFQVRERRLAGYSLTTPPAPGFYVFNGISGVSQAGLNFGNTTHDILAIGTDAGGGPNVVVLDGRSKATLFNFFAYDTGFVGGVRVAVGDVNGDGAPDIITAPGAGGGPDIHVYDGATGALMQRFWAFDPRFSGGSFVAAGDVNGDGFADIIVGADSGGGPNVAAFSGRT